MTKNNGNIDIRHAYAVLTCVYNTILKNDRYYKVYTCALAEFLDPPMKRVGGGGPVFLGDESAARRSLVCARVCACVGVRLCVVCVRRCARVCVCCVCARSRII